MAESQNETFNFTNGMAIVLQQGPIAGGDTDVVVNPTLTNLNLVQNCSLKEYIDTEIVREIQLECNAKAPMGLELGEYVVTNVGKGFENSFVYHVACWEEAGESLDYQEYVSLLTESFQAASDMNKFSIALPAMKIKLFSNQQEATDQDLAKLIIDMCMSLAACSDYKLRNILLNFGTKEGVLYGIYKEVLTKRPEYETKRQSSSPDYDEDATEQAKNFKVAIDVFSKADTMNIREIHFVVSDDAICSMFSKVILAKTGTIDQSPVNVHPSRRADSEFTVKYKGVNVTVKEGIFTAENVDCIVHGYFVTANLHPVNIQIHDDIGRMLLQKGGTAFKRICDTNLIKKHALQFTDGGTLCKEVLHIDVSAVKSNGHFTWENFTYKCLTESDGRRLQSIVFPVLIREYEDAQSGQQISGVKAFIDSTSRIQLKDIRFVVDNVALLKSYKDLMRNTFGSTSEDGYNASENKQKPQIHTPALSTNKSRLKIEVVEGDITKYTSDMIVHATKGSYGAGIHLNVGLSGALPDARELVSHFKAAIREFEASRPAYLQLIRFVIHDKSLLKTYREVLQVRSNTGGAVPSGAVLNPVPTDHDLTLTGGYTGDLDMSIVCGDLTKEITECIVHATQNPISFGGQSGGALKKAGGPDFEREATTAKYGKLGNTVLTSAGNMLCKHVLHLNMPKSGTLLKDKLEVLTDRILECLNTANDAKIKSL